MKGPGLLLLPPHFIFCSIVIQGPDDNIPELKTSLQKSLVSLIQVRGLLSCLSAPNLPSSPSSPFSVVCSRTGRLGSSAAAALGPSRRPLSRHHPERSALRGEPNLLRRLVASALTRADSWLRFSVGRERRRANTIAASHSRQGGLAPSSADSFAHFAVGTISPPKIRS